MSEPNARSGRSPTARSVRSTSSNAVSGDTRVCGRCGRSASAPSSPASTTAGTSASAPVGSAACCRGHRHGGHVLLPRLLDRRDVAGSPPHRRRVLVRPVGHGPVGRVPHRSRREHGVRDHAGGGRRRDGPADADRSSSACSTPAEVRRGGLRGIAWWNSLPFWWAVFYVIFVWINIVGIEATMRFTVTITVLSLAVLAFFFLAAIVSGKFDFEPVDEHPEGRRRRARRRAAGRCFPFGISGIFKSLPFAIWFFLAIEEVPLAAEESMDPRRDVPRGSMLAMHTLLIAAILTLFINTGAARRGVPVRRSPGSRSWTASRRSSAGEKVAVAAGAAVHDRPGRELLHDHLRVRAEHVLAVAGRATSRVPVEHARRAEDAARGADRRRGRRLRGRRARVHPAAERARARRSSRRC